MQDHFRVGGCFEFNLWMGLSNFLPDRLEIIYLAVEDNDVSSIVGDHGLVGCLRKINHAETGVAQSHLAVVGQPGRLCIGTAVTKLRNHGLNVLSAARIPAYHTGNSTHSFLVSAAILKRRPHAGCPLPGASGLYPVPVSFLKCRACAVSYRLPSAAADAPRTRLSP